MTETSPAQRYFRIAIQAWEINNLSAAEHHCRRALGFQTNHADSWHLLGLIYSRNGQGLIANALIRQALVHSPFNVQYWFNLGNQLQMQERLHDACSVYAECLRLDPMHLGACNNQIEVLRRTEKLSAALSLCDHVEKLGIPAPGLHCHRAICFHLLGQTQAAESAFRQALDQVPRLITVAWEFSHLLLSQMRFEEGWKHYETRFDAPWLLGMNCARLPIPRWQGESLAGKTILLHREQGLGDQIMFASVIPELLAADAKVLLDVALPLRTLFASSFPAARLAPLDSNDAIDLDRLASSLADETPGRSALDFKAPEFEAPLGSACGRQRSAREHFPGMPYCVPSAASLLRWQQRLSTLPMPTGLRIGLVWSTNPARGMWSASHRARRKSIPIEAFDVLAQPGRQWISLHDQPITAYGTSQLEVTDFSADLHDFQETAALALTLNLLITVDTAVAHLGGALGVPTWILLPHNADWRWADHAAEQSYWYRSVRLFRQTTPGDWAGVLNRVANALNVEESLLSCERFHAHSH